MSLGGILGAGVAGGAKAVGDQLTTDIKNQEDQRIWSERQAILEQANLRALDYQDKIAKSKFLFEKDPNQAGGAAALAQSKALGSQATEEEVRKSALMEKTKREQAIAEANDPAFMAATKAIKENDPLVKAQILQATAAAGASSMHTKLLGEQLRETQGAYAVATKVRGLQDLLAKTTNEASRNAIQQQITDLGFSGKDVTKYLALVDKAMDNAKDAIKVMSDPSIDEPTRQKALQQWSQANDLARQMAQAGGVKLKEPTAPSAPQGAIDLLLKDPSLKTQFDAKYGAGSADMVLSGKGSGILDSGKSVPTRRDPISGEMLNENQWDKKYGRGDFKNLYQKGEDSLKSF